MSNLRFLDILIYKILIIIKNFKILFDEIGLGGFREDWGVATSKRFGLGGAGSFDWMGEVSASISDSSEGEEYSGGEGDWLFFDFCPFGIWSKDCEYFLSNSNTRWYSVEIWIKIFDNY